MSKLIQFTRAFLAGLSILMISFAAEGQCLVNRDSLTAGDRATGFTDYQYVGGNIAQAYTTDSGAGQPTRAYVVAYDNNIPSKISFVNIPDTIPNRIIWFTISSGKVVSVRDSSNDNGNPQIIVHDIAYDGSGKIESIDLDTALSNGGGGIPGSFTNIVWGTDGNVTSMNLEINQGPVIEFTVETDNKNNIAKKLPPVEGALDLLFAANTNNVTGIKFVNEEDSIGSASAQPGQYAIEKRLSYTTNNDVCSSHFPPTFFEPNKDYVIEYHYSCAGECVTSGISSAKDVRNISLYPNPASDIISIENGFFTGTVKIFDASGKEAARIEAAQPLSSLHIGRLQPGMYYVEFTDGQKIFRGKVLKN